MNPVLPAIASPIRQRVLRLVWDHERSAGEIAAQFNVTFSAVSQHLKVLRDAGVVTRRREGKTLYYRADHAALGPLAQALAAMWDDRLGDLKRLAEQEAPAAERLEAKSKTPTRRPPHVRPKPSRRKP